MLFRTLIAAFTFALTASVAQAHVSVRPREAKPGATDTYIVRVPTEGKVATTSVELDIPQGVTVESVEPAEGVKTDTKRDGGGRIVSITWTTAIEPGANREFTFAAKNPGTGTEIVWKAHQRYADGTSSEWVGAAGTRQPAPVTKLTAAGGDGAPLKTRPLIGKHGTGREVGVIFDHLQLEYNTHRIWHL